MTRQPGVSDLIWLSWGEGRIWGLINVGNGEKFAADCQGHEQLMDEQGGMLVEQARANIIQEHCFFEHIDRPESPINVLIGSRKFSEGWNCFRVSVVGLINLGSGKGNKIIQIFGRGVRLHGQNQDGKRRHPDHHGDYDSLAEEQNPLDRLRCLETLNIFSLKKSYLETFLKGVGKDLPVPMDYHIPLKPRPVVVRGSELPFEQYSPKLKAPRVGLKSFDSLLRIIRNSEDQNWTWEYLYEKGPEKQTINHFAITLDYSPGQDDHSQDIRHALYKWLERNQAFLPLSRWRTRMEAWEQRQKTQVLVQNNDGLLEKPDMLEVLSWPGRVGYIAGPEDRGFPAVISLTEQIQGDILNKVRNTIINDINKRKYRLDEILQQTTDDQPGDFAGWQNLHLSCKSESDRGRAKNKVTAKIRTIEKKLRLDLCEPKANYHIYGPLFDEKLKDELEEINILKFDGAYPPLLNSGESKFVRDLTKYLRQPAVRKSSYEFYLMRNEASMRSVGLYLQAQLQAFFPDFVLWIVEEKRPVTHILLIDPKGQTGILDPKTLETNEKVSIATNGHLDELAEKMTATHGRKFRLHSFILLRDSSLLGTCASIRPSSRELKIIENMQSKNVLRLDWSETKEDGSSTNALFNGKSYLDMMFEKAGILL